MGKKQRNKKRKMENKKVAKLKARRNNNKSTHTPNSIQVAARTDEQIK